jgi:5-methylcytosine-specific restriction endonuclease McrA
MESYIKLCPSCQTATALQATRCHRCSHIYRTHFDPVTGQVEWLVTEPRQTSAAPQKPALRNKARQTISKPEKRPIAVRRDPLRCFSKLQRREIWLRSNGHCVGCGQYLGSDWQSGDWQADHIFPHCRGGRTEVINGQALCQPCNNRKKANVLTVDEKP